MISSLLNYAKSQSSPTLDEDTVLQQLVSSTPIDANNTAFWQHDWSQFDFSTFMLTAAAGRYDMLEETFANVVVIETIVSGSSVDVEGGDHSTLDTHEQLIVNQNVIQLLQVTTQLMHDLNSTELHQITTNQLLNAHNHLLLCRYLLIHIVQQAVRLIPSAAQQSSMLPMLLSAQLCQSMYDQMVDAIARSAYLQSTSDVHRDVISGYEEYCQEVYTLLLIYQMEQLYQPPMQTDVDIDDSVMASSYVNELPCGQFDQLVTVLLSVIVGRGECTANASSAHGTGNNAASTQPTRTRSASIGQWLASAATQPFSYMLNYMPAAIQNLQQTASVSPLVLRAATVLTLFYHSESHENAAAVHKQLHTLSPTGLQQLLQTIINKSLLSNSSTLHTVLPFVHVLILSNAQTVQQLFAQSSSCGATLLHALAIDLCHPPQDSRYHRTMMSLMVLRQILTEPVDDQHAHQHATQLLSTLHQHIVPRPKVIPTTTLPKSVTSLTLYQLLTHSLTTMLQTNTEPHRYKLLTTTFGVQLLGPILHRLLVDLIIADQSDNDADSSSQSKQRQQAILTMDLHTSQTFSTAVYQLLQCFEHHMHEHQSHLSVAGRQHQYETLTVDRLQTNTTLQRCVQLVQVLIDCIEPTHNRNCSTSQVHLYYHIIPLRHTFMELASFVKLFNSIQLQAVINRLNQLRTVVNTAQPDSDNSIHPTGLPTVLELDSVNECLQQTATTVTDGSEAASASPVLLDHVELIVPSSWHLTYLWQHLYHHQWLLSANPQYIKLFDGRPQAKSLTQMETEEEQRQRMEQYYELVMAESQGVDIQSLQLDRQMHGHGGLKVVTDDETDRLQHMQTVG